MVGQFSRVTSPLSALLLEPMGGAVARVGKGETAFPHRDARYNLAIIGRWADRKDEDRHVAWVRAVHDGMTRFTTGGVYVNYLGDEGQDRVRAAYGSEAYTRLARSRTSTIPETSSAATRTSSPARPSGSSASEQGLVRAPVRSTPGRTSACEHYL
jgi:hypothetical protein